MEIPDFPGYTATEDGEVISTRFGRPMRKFVGKRGYYTISIVRGDRRYTRTVGALVCAAFHGPRPTRRHQCCHRDGNKLNDAADNLYWGTQAANEADKVAHGRSNRGARNGNAVLTPDLVAEIRTMRRRGSTQQAIADTFGISQSQVSRICRRKRWAF